MVSTTLTPSCLLFLTSNGPSETLQTVEHNRPVRSQPARTPSPSHLPQRTSLVMLDAIYSSWIPAAMPPRRCTPLAMDTRSKRSKTAGGRSLCIAAASRALGQALHKRGVKPARAGLGQTQPF